MAILTGCFINGMSSIIASVIFLQLEAVAKPFFAAAAAASVLQNHVGYQILCSRLSLPRHQSPGGAVAAMAGVTPHKLI